MSISANSKGFGYNQTWQDVTASRALNTTYTNTSGKPIMVNLVTTNTGISNGVRLTVNGVILKGHDPVTSTTGFVMTLMAIVPPLGTYSASNTLQNLTTWNELR